MEPDRFELESIFDSTDKTINQSLQEFLTLQEIQTGMTNSLSLEAVNTGRASISPRRSVRSEDRQAVNDHHVNDSKPSAAKFTKVKELYDVDKMHDGSQIFNDGEFADDLSQQEFDFPHHIQSNPVSDPELTPAQLLPGLVKINVLLTEKGYLPLTLIASDVNSSTK